MSHFKAVESVKHANWFEIEASDNTVRIMVRIIKGMTHSRITNHYDSSFN